MFRKWISDLRYNYWISKFLVFVLWPFSRLLSFLTGQIQRKVKINGGVVDYDGFKLMVPKNVGIGFMSNIFWKGVEGFEPLTWQVIKNSCRQADVFFDIGSHFGFYSVLVQQLNENIVTRCYEPIPELFQDNLAFHEENRVKRQMIVNRAISDVHGPIEIQIPLHQKVREVRSASVEKTFFYNQNFKTRTLRIEATTLDRELDGNNDLIGKRVVVKIDIEGHEWAALQGGKRFMASIKPIVICEIDRSSSHLVNVIDSFSTLGYRAYAIVREGLFHIEYDDISSFEGGRDFLMLHGESPKSYISFTNLGNYAWGSSK